MKNSNKCLKKDFNVKIRKNGFTLIELLTVVGIIAMLIGLLLPALAEVRRTVKEAQQKAQFSTIAMALEAFKGDYGDYPESNFFATAPGETTEWEYEGAQRLAEALVGRDLLGFHPDSDWHADGRNEADDKFIYPIPPATFTPQQLEKNLKERKGPYIEDATRYAFKLEASSDGAGDGLYYPSLLPPPLRMSTSGIKTSTYVICDVFGVRKISTYNQTATEIVSSVKAGTPILYFKANTASKRMSFADRLNSIYNVDHNRLFYNLPHLADLDKPAIDRRQHPIMTNIAMFYNAGTPPYDTYKLIDTKVTTTLWPHNPDSYILISAGEDGLYGNQDDITNF